MRCPDRPTLSAAERSCAIEGSMALRGTMVRGVGSLPGPIAAPEGIEASQTAAAAAASVRRTVREPLLAWIRAAVSSSGRSRPDPAAAADPAQSNLDSVGNGATELVSARPRPRLAERQRGCLWCCDAQTVAIESGPPREG